MSILENTLIGLIFLFCGYASYTDLKYRKIRNLCSFGLIYGGTLRLLLSWLYGNTSLGEAVSLLLGGGLIAFGSYWFNIFAPGDAKFFWGLSLMLPTTLFSDVPEWLRFPPLILASNALVPYAVVLMIYMVFKTSLAQKRQALFECFSEKEKLKNTLFDIPLFVGCGFLVSPLLDQLPWQAGWLIRVIVIVSFFKMIKGVIDKLQLDDKHYGFIYVAGLWTLSCLWFIGKVSWLPVVGQILIFLCLYTGVYIFSMRFLMNLASLTFDREIAILRLQEGMVPSEQIVRVVNSDGSPNYEKRQTGQAGILDNNIVLDASPEGCSVENIQELKRLASEGCFDSFDNKIKVQPSIRFAPILSVGAILTIICKGPFYLKLMDFF